MSHDPVERTAEPELMNDPAQAEAYASADFSEPHDAFVAHFERRFPGFAGGRVLDLGCGAADVTLRFARAFPGAEMVGVEGADAMLGFAEKAIAAAGMKDRVRLLKARLPDRRLGRRDYDAVISNSLLHHLDDPLTLWRTVTATAKPRAPVLVMDLLRPTSMSEAASLVERYAADAPSLLRRDFYGSLLAAYRPDEVRAQLDAAGLSDFRVETVSDRHLLVWGRA